jgi:hypothetical protein
VNLYWEDPRYNMSMFWDNMFIEGGYPWSGYDISTFMTNGSLTMWKPEVTFLDAISVDIISEVTNVFNLFHYSYSINH